MERMKAIKKNKSTSSTVSSKNNTEMYSDNVSNTVNLGTYDIYDKTSGSDFQLNSKVENNNVVFDLNYYLIELSWQEGIQFSDYLKETDLMYVIVNAMQLEPQENETTTTSAESQ